MLKAIIERHEANVALAVARSRLLEGAVFDAKSWQPALNRLEAAIQLVTAHEEAGHQWDVAAFKQYVYEKVRELEVERIALKQKGGEKPDLVVEQRAHARSFGAPVSEIVRGIVDPEVEALRQEELRLYNEVKAERNRQRLEREAEDAWVRTCAANGIDPKTGKAVSATAEKTGWLVSEEDRAR